MREVTRVKNNKGFSLVELIVTIAILAVVMLGVGLMLSSGTNLFSAVSRSEGEQTELQIALAQIHERVIDCKGIVVSSNKISIFVDNADDPDDKKLVEFTYNAADKTLSLMEYGVTNGVKEASGEGGILCRDVKSFSAEIKDDALLTVSMTIRSITDVQYTALRTAKVFPNVTDMLVELDPQEVES